VHICFRWSSTEAWTIPRQRPCSAALHGTEVVAGRQQQLLLLQHRNSSDIASMTRSSSRSHQTSGQGSAQTKQGHKAAAAAMYGSKSHNRASVRGSHSQAEQGADPSSTHATRPRQQSGLPCHQHTAADASTSSHNTCGVWRLGQCLTKCRPLYLVLLVLLIGSMQWKGKGATVAGALSNVLQLPWVRL
jgi:hypothetical protein